MKRWLLVLSLCCALLFSGCVQVSALQELAVVQGVGVDAADGRYELTLQVFSAEGSGGQTILDPSQQNAQVITCTGATITEALSQTALSQGRSFFLGHDRLLILGEGTRELPLSDLLHSLSGSLGLREDVMVLAAEKTAREILECPVNQGVLPALTIEQTVQNAAGEGRIPQVRLLDLNRALSEAHRSAVIPLIRAEEGQQDLKTLSLTGAALYAQDDFCGTLGQDALSGLLLFADETKNMPFIVSDPAFGSLGLRIYRCSSRLIPDLTAGIRFTLRIDAKAAVSESALKVGGSLRNEDDAADRELLQKAETLLAERIRLCCEAAFSETVIRRGCDILGLGDVVWRQQPELFRALSESWPGEMTVDYDIRVKIDRVQEN
ncbi:MAG: Ger(x)C family spore germination C-terminal domain-containing protein [Oscillospiraceae bacterium]|nr:Ger(x)C family spore germination C-terminal domain-containing protein [Oscillospiraceae bacterium]